MMIKLAIVILMLTAALPGVTRPAHSQTPQRHANLLTIEDGLSQGVVTCILQDGKGFMWFGTMDGLNRYDGSEFKIYYLSEGSAGGNNENYINALHESPPGILWIGTQGGLVRFDQTADRFTYYQHDPRDPAGLSDNDVINIRETPDGSLWLGTSHGGLNRFDRETGLFTHYRAAPDDPHGLSRDVVRTQLVDRDHTLWLGTGRKLYRYDREKDRFDRFKLPPPPPGARYGNIIRGLYQDKQGMMWLGTAANALYRFDPAAERFMGPPLSIGYRHPNPESNNIITLHEDNTGVFWAGSIASGLFTLDRTTGVFTPFKSVPFPTIYSTCEDRSGILWFGSKDGISKLNPTTGGFSLFRLPRGDVPGAPVNVFSAILEDHLGFLWFGVERDGLIRMDRTDGRLTRFSADIPGPGKLNSKLIRSIYEDDSGVLWVGTELEGVFRLHRETGVFTAYAAPPGRPGAPFLPSVFAIVEGDNDTLWMGSYGKGLAHFSRATEQIKPYRHVPDNPDSLGSDFITALHRDALGLLWIATDGGGVNSFNPETGIFKRYTYVPSNPGAIGNNSIFSICEDASGALWFGSVGDGINKFDRQTEVFTRYSRKDGLPNNAVYCIEADENGFIWISTNRGLSRFDPDTETFENYDVHDGLQSNEFNALSSYKSRTGELFFGGVNGLNWFFPGKMKKNPHIPPVVITGFKLFNNPVTVGPDSPLKTTALFAESIRLRYDENFFSFQFAAMDFTNPGKNSYAYKLEGYDRDWVAAEASERRANYTGVPPGEYVFRVKGSNNDGVWNEAGTSIRVVIPPPFWRTLWFRALVLLLFLAAGYKAYQIRVRFIALKVRNEVEIKTIFDKYKTTEREMEIIKLVLKGKSNKEIEDALYLSSHTIKNHIYRIYKKYNVRSRSQLITLINGSITH